MTTKQELNEHNDALRRHIRDLQEKIRVATARLSTIASGMHYASECRSEWALSDKLQVTAAEGLKKLATMVEREAP